MIIQQNKKGAVFRLFHAFSSYLMGLILFSSTSALFSFSKVPHGKPFCRQDM
jgi:hypothetical protein